jgi:hypothetical protein
MNNKYADIKDISFLNSNVRTFEEFKKLFDDNLFSDDKKWDSFELSHEIHGLMDNITSRMKYSMGTMSLGIYNVLEKGPYPNIQKSDEIFLFSGFAEIETVNKIGTLIMENNFSINPALFPNSVHHVALSYFTILKKLNNYTVAINDGPNTNYSFINFIAERSMIPENFIIATGEEYSNFFTFDLNQTKKIVPSFTAYKVIPGSKKGFRFIGTFKNKENILKENVFKEAGNVFCDKVSFSELSKENVNKKLFSEYPIVKENPCGIITRLALPFYFDIRGISIVIEKIKDIYYLFEVSL